MGKLDDGNKGASAPFHAGESALQTRAGVEERIARIGRTVIRDHLIDQHREFFTLLPTLLIGALDGQGQPWASMLAGAPGLPRRPMHSACASPHYRVPMTL